MKVSVIIPNYNHSHYLHQRVESVLAQTYQDFELILLDDKSTDGSWGILQQYKDNPHVSQLVRNEVNTGSPFPQWEKGLKLAQGEYVWIAESDDFCTPSFLETCVEQLEKYPNAVLCHTGSIFVDAEGKPMAKTFDPWKEDGRARVFPNKEYINHNMTYWDECYNASKVVFRKSVYEKIGKEYTTFRCAGDWLFMESLMLHGDIIVVHKKLNRFRWHDAKVTIKSEDDGSWLYDKIRLYEELIKIAPITRFNKLMICGIVYKAIVRLSVEKEAKDKLYAMAEHSLGMKRWHYLLERVVKTLTNVMPILPEGKRYYLI